METRANYLMVGLFVLALSAGLVVFVVWLARYELEGSVERFDIHYEGSVTGLQDGSPVRYKGLRVGEVAELGIAPHDPERVLITIEVEEHTPIRSDTMATVEIEGLTGTRFVHLSGSSPSAAPLRVEPGQTRPVIASAPSSLQQVLDEAPAVVESVNILVARANDLLSPENRKHIGDSLANLAAFTGALAEQREALGTLIGDASATMTNLRGASRSLESLVGSFEEAHLPARVDATLGSVQSMTDSIDRSVGATAEEAQALIGDLQKTVTSLTRTSNELKAMISENREPVRDFTADGLPELTLVMNDVRDLVSSLNRVLLAVERDPARFFFGNQQQGYEPR